MKKERRVLRQKNLAEGTVYEIEKNLVTYKDDINEAEKSQIDSLISDVRKAIVTNNKHSIENSTKKTSRNNPEDIWRSLSKKVFERGSITTSTRRRRACG